MKLRYRIYQLSARTVMSYAKQNDDGEYIFELTPLATEKSKAPSALHEQEDNALFYQIMCELHGNNFDVPEGTNLITDLSDVICYIDFAGIFDRNNGQKKYSDRQLKARDMFRTRGIKLDFGTGSHRYVSFERSASMSRSARLSFIRADLHDNVRRRIMMDMDIGVCQLSKLYAYNGLMLSGGTRVDGVDIEKPHRVIVVENNSFKSNATVITVDDDGTDNTVRKYTRVEKHIDFNVVEHDGEGLISKEFASVIDKKFCGMSIHNSFQIRMPYVKGMLHQVDFKKIFSKAGVTQIKDIWGQFHPADEVDIILTESMFKAYGWFRDCNMSWEDYWVAFKKYNHALYITNVNKTSPEKFTELNYQFLNTLSIKADEFRPKDLPDGWDHSPEDDERSWLTKQTETEYFNLCNNEEYRLQYFTKYLSYKGIDKNSKPYLLASVLNQNPLFINEPIFADELSDKAESVLRKYALGNLIIAGDNRYLSGDLLYLVSLIMMDSTRNSNIVSNRVYADFLSTHFAKNSFYAPGAIYDSEGICTLLRNPHIARNEEIILKSYEEVEKIRRKYFGHLTDVIMVDSEMYAAERLGGADFDGDMIKSISDPILNNCVRRNYDNTDYFDNNNNIPFLMIPSASALTADSTDWEARFETVKSTFSSRVGQISNAALDRSIVAYNENIESSEREKYREETETLAILIGLEIDAVKTGVKPDLSKYLDSTNSNLKRSIFLQYKNKFAKCDAKVKGAKEKLDKFFESINWDEVASNVERLPNFSRLLGQNTPKIKPVSSKDSELFSFATDSNWKDDLDKNILKEVKSLIAEYDKALDRIRKSKSPYTNCPRKGDIERIIYSQGKDTYIDSDTLYAEFTIYDQDTLKNMLGAIKEEKWHLMNPDERLEFLHQWVPELTEYFNILSDFRHGGFRIFGDLVMDSIYDATENEKRKLHRESDSENIKQMLDAYENRIYGDSYRDAVSKKCREMLDRIIKPREAIKYAVALGKRNFMWDVLLDEVPKHVLKRRDDV